MIRDLAANGGVIQINYEKTYLDQAYREAYDSLVGNVVTGTDDIAKACGDGIDCYWRENVKVLGGNLLRVMEQSERVCREMQATEHRSDRS